MARPGKQRQQNVKTETMYISNCKNNKNKEDIPVCVALFDNSKSEKNNS
jgi:hypothetical protein